ncbi:MAG: N-acetyl-gamma-glutamyl-phosphate reductase [Pseudomonadales bacterium]|nr:N-acetyl-gamma-glutamyl-phosphate reductase [Pseudomonadales bacterium]
MTTRIAIMGASGYTALELLTILARHPHAEVVLVTTRRADAPSLSVVHPRLKGVYDLELSQVNPQQIIDEAEFVFSCLPHAASAETVAPLVDAGLKVVDLSADYRLRDAAVYEEWYGLEHPDPARLGTVPYGLPEFYRDEIRAARLVANPGCYPTSVILPLMPLLQAKIICPTDMIVDSKSGVTGAGRTAALPFHYPEANENLKAYAVGQHRHTPEIIQFCSLAAGTDADVIFTPHLTPMNRGILSTCYVSPCEGFQAADANRVLLQCYDDEPFVRVRDNPPETKDVTGTNYCDLFVADSGSRLVVMSCLDNMVKGASGAAVQNFNLMCGYDEQMGLEL